jgi:hypothetical protein
MTAPNPGEGARLAELEERKAWRDGFTAQHGMPEQVSAADALALASAAGVPIDPTATAGDTWASIYRDHAVADAWLESNRVHHGHPTLAKVPLPDGRVIGILDLRPAMERMTGSGIPNAEVRP